MASSGQTFLGQRLGIPLSVGCSRVQILSLDALPNELLIEILASLPTKDLLLSVTLVCHQFQAMISGIVQARLLHFYPPKSLPLTLKCYYPKAPMDHFRALCPPATYLDTVGLATDVCYAGEISPRHAAINDGFRHLYSRFVLNKPLIRPITIEFAEYVCKFCTTLSLLTHVSPSSTVSWLVTQNRTFELTRAWMAKRVTRRHHAVAAEIERKPNANHGIKCSNSKFSSEVNIHTMWTDENKNFGLRVRIENCTGPLNEREFMPSASYNIHIQGLIIRSVFLLLRIEEVTAARKNLFMHIPNHGI